MAKQNLRSVAQAVSVTRYLEYQEYLAELYRLMKSKADSYSYLKFAEDLGFAPTNVIRLVIARKRKLSEKSARTIVEALDLRHEDRKYFIHLVRYTNVKNPSSKAAIFMRIYHEKQSALTNHADRDLMEYHKAWFYPIVRELLHQHRESHDPQILAQQLYPKLSAEQIEEAIQLLQRLDMVKWNEESGRWQLTKDQPGVYPEDRTANVMSVMQFHKDLLDVGKECLDVVPRSEREYNALTIRVDQDQIPELKAKIREFCSSLLALEPVDHPGDSIIQINIQMFPFTKAKPKGA